MNPPMLFAKAVAIDLDGTLIDTEVEVCSAVNLTLQQFGRVALSARQIVSLTGKGSRSLIEAALKLSQLSPQSNQDLPSYSDQLINSALTYFSSTYKSILGTQAKVYGSVRDGLNLLQNKQLRMVCVTNKSEPDAVYLLKHFKLAAYFESILAPRCLAERKPAPYLLDKAAMLMGIHPTQLVLIGDSNNDVLAARAASSSVIRLATGYDRYVDNKIPADISCQTFLEATQAINLHS